MANMEPELLPVEILNPNKVRVYKKWVDCVIDGSHYDRSYKRFCIMNDDNTQCHRYIDYNKFTVETCALPDDTWKLKKDDQQWIRKYVCNPDVEYFSPNPNIYDKHTPYKQYKTEDNGGTGFVVLVDADTSKGRGVIIDNDILVVTPVHIYGRVRDKAIIEEHIGNEFERHIATYDAIEVFIGKSGFNRMTSYSGGYGDKWDGNSILLRIQSEDNSRYKYVHIGIKVFEFYTDDPVIKYISSVGNNCIPYPYAETATYGYTMNGSRALLSELPDREERGNISHMDGVNYKAFDMIEICDRDSTSGHYIYHMSENTSMFRFKGPVEISMPPATSDIKNKES